MSKASWLNVNPTSGSGNGTVNVSTLQPHTGRSARSTNVTITAANVEPVIVAVNQAGKPEFVSAQDNAAAPKGGQNVTISGKSNSQKLTFTLGTGSLDVVIPANYTAAGVSTANGTNITGDPGATAEFDWSIVINVPENATIEELSKQIIVTDENGNHDTCALTQSAGDPVLTVNKESIDLTWEGTAQSFAVTSNTSWTIS